MFPVAWASRISIIQKLIFNNFKGTEHFDGKQHKFVDVGITDVLQMVGRAGRPQYDNEAVAMVFAHDIKKQYYKKFLYEPFPVESNLLDVLPDHLNAELVAGTIRSKLGFNI